MLLLFEKPQFAGLSRACRGKSTVFLIESAPMPEDNDELSAEIDALKERLDELESDVGTGAMAGLIGYVMGMALAIVLSWSRNASILYCILHGILSWIYVIYFAVTR